MHKKEFFPLYCVHISRFHSAVTSNPKSFSPAATLDPRPRLWTRDRDFGPATCDPRILVKLFWKASFFAKQRLITRTSFVYKTSRLVRISLLINALNKRVCFFSRESYFIKSVENFFPVFAYPDINTRGVGRILGSYANPRLRLEFA